MEKIKFKKINSNAQLPKQSSDLAGGWDVTATEIIKESENYYRCKLGFALQPPKGYKITIVPRSSLTKYNWVVNNSPVLGDEDYTGEYEIRFRGIPIGVNDLGNLIYDEFPFSVNQRISQLYLEEVIPIEFEEVEELNNSTRGSNGFGSTGK